ncbi:MAG: VanZ family protein [Bacteroidales bacterium]|nr:VanZ family protein [Clostridium sp.]MCM1204582.1 VanZ family protein [Bacteroidales bacterium]
MEELILAELLMTGYEFLTVFVPAAAVLRVFCLRDKKEKKENTRGHIIWMLVFAVYLFGVFHVTGAGTIFHIKQYGLAYSTQSVNLIPFSDTNIDLVGYGLNVVLFVPLGFLLPLIWSDLNKMKYACIAGSALSLLVEISQLLNIRATDIDDLILNTLGTVLGFFLFRLFFHITKREIRTKARGKWEAVIYISTVFVCRFLLYNEFGMAKLLYGF